MPDSAAATNTSRTQVADASQVWTLLAVAVAVAAAVLKVSTRVAGGGQVSEGNQTINL